MQAEAWRDLVGKTITGLVVSIMEGKQFGYISAESVADRDGTPIDIFFHKTALSDNCRMDELRPGKRVSFILLESERGLKGAEVKLA